MSKRKSSVEKSRPAATANVAAGRHYKQLLPLTLFVCGLLAYLVAFYQCPLPSLGADANTGQPLRRSDLFAFLLLPELVTERWFGGPGERAVLDRAPVIATAAGILLIAGLLGWTLLRLGRVCQTLTRLETVIFSLGVGLSAVSLYTLAVGLSGRLQSAWVFLLPGLAVTVAAAAIWWRDRHQSNAVPASKSNDAMPDPWPTTPWLGLGIPFVVAILLGGMLPPVDFDVREYHAQAPKEFFHNGRISFLPHNIYANMTLGTELLALPAMAVLGDWWLGALVGKTLIAAYAPLTALGVYSAGRRFISPVAGIVGALVYISTPWVARVSTDGLVDGAAAFYLLLSLYAVLLWREQRSGSSQPPAGLLLLAGFLSGSAVACKYPAALFVVLPLATYVAWTRKRRYSPWEGEAPAEPKPGTFRLGEAPADPSSGFSTAKPTRFRSATLSLTIFLFAVLLGCGPWFAKNWALTRNPVYPLAYELFDGRTRTHEKNAQWVRAHSPNGYIPRQLGQSVLNFTLRSEWLSPLLFPLAVMAFVRKEHRPFAVLLAAYCLYVLAAWWLLTHRIDRFWIPLLPVISLLAGTGATWTAELRWRRCLAVFLVLGLAANLLVVTSVGYSRYFVALDRLRVDPDRVDPWHLYLNDHVPPGETVLLVGDAQPFDLEMPALYNTTFDDSIFEGLVAGHSPDEIRKELAWRRVRFVYVHWGEIARYRATYGFTPFVQPEVFQRLVRSGVLAPPLPPLEGHSGQLFPVIVDVATRTNTVE